MEKAVGSIQVINVLAAIIALDKLGVKAVRNPKLKDEIIVQIKDKNKVVKWMLGPGGWDKEDIKDVYPELLSNIFKIFTLKYFIKMSLLFTFYKKFDTI